ncbi:related to dehydrogenases with different specificities (related to short-chain alcohol dehydrogenases) [Ramularia collo-cygni]|uniref:Related to dehydrogenases with different specificities (Related to short-chain alcohol dehydrogenases) n=1 Tax=Ramularia collo-cygni TaxID=112498 RepID=A0A2D3VPM5_9PEZI|nr:related to dehydrogenases with different specificities (related to short-chain alcohol dehydrogenases) [Ramularia collo-cygni]CZT23928.1 related to dehydrogenases with different specificities (related to short-chain alcohol dehydrogenases) [Ramularia collo-cygni]
MTKSLVLITGGNNGLGYYATQQLAASGNYTVLMGSRDHSRAEKAITALLEDQSMKVTAGDVHPVQIDVTSDESIYAAAKHVRETYGYLDILMLNAGITQQQAETEDSPSLRQLYHNHFDTNLFGAAVTLEAFLPLLRESKAPGGKRIAFTSSGLASFKLADNGPASCTASLYPIYRSTKTAMNMIMLGYAKQLEGEGFVVSCSDPGYCATDINGHQGMKDPREGAKALVKAATGDKTKVHGGVVNEENDERLPW